MSFRESEIKALIEFAVNTAFTNQAQSFEQKLKDIESRFAKTSVTVLEIELFRDAEIIPGVSCEETLDVGKSVPLRENMRRMSHGVRLLTQPIKCLRVM